MRITTWRNRLYLAFALLALPLLACAQPGMMSDEQRAQMMGQYPGPGAYGSGWGMGPGMMGGAGPGAGWGGGPGMMGPGMMGYGMGPGMMGMMMGPGMMGYGMAPGTAGGSLYGLDLTDKQRAQINEVQQQARKRQWQLHGELIDEQAKLSKLYLNDKPDSKQVGQVYGNLARLQQQMAEIGIETHNRMFDVLTSEQREQLQQWRSRMFGAGPGVGQGYGPGRPPTNR